MLNVDKTEWLLVSSRRTLCSLHITRPVLQLGGNIVAASDHVRLLGVDIVSDLSLERYYCKKLNSLKHLVRTNVAESHN